MKALVCAVTVIALAGPSTAQSRYDRKLEEAVIAIVAAKIGHIRGGFAFDAKPVMVIVQDNTVMGTTDMNATRLAPPEGMARAMERKTAVPTTF
jgi:hypothetical protein